MIMDGKIVREKVFSDLINKLSGVNDIITLVVIQVGNDEASMIYISQKELMCKKLGYKFKKYWFDNDVCEENLISLIKKLNNDSSVTGILVQLPLPEHINYVNVVNSIDYKKDVDGLTDFNTGRLVHNRNCLISCTPYGIIKMLDYYDIDLKGKNVVIVGRSDLVGKPLIPLLLKKDASVSICHSKTSNLSEYTLSADILIVAVGKKHFIKANMVKEGVVIIDVGISKDGTKLYGDVDFDNVVSKSSYLTPVPGGVGVMTVTMLGFNLYNAYLLQKGDKQ